MSLVQNFKRDLQRLNDTENVRIQSELISQLIGSINIFVTRVKEEESLVDNITTLKKRIDKGKETLEPTELKEMEDLLAQAKHLERTIKAKRDTLKSLRTQLKSVIKLAKKR